MAQHLLLDLHVPTYSPTRTQLNNRTRVNPEFIPFIQERDSLGRLLKDQQPSHQQFLKNQFVVPKQSQLDSRINRIFTCKSVELVGHGPSRIYKKTSISSYNSSPTSKRSINPLTRKAATIRPDPHKQPHQRHQQINNRNESYSIALLSRMSSESPQKAISSVVSTQRMSAPVEGLFKKQIAEPVKPQKAKASRLKRAMTLSVRPVLEPVKLLTPHSKPLECPELARFYQMRRLSIKIVPDFEENHEKFLGLIKEAKIKAHQVRRSIINA